MIKKNSKKKTVKAEKKIQLVVEVSKETKRQLDNLKTEHGINKNISVRNAIQLYYNEKNNI